MATEWLIYPSLFALKSRKTWLPSLLARFLHPLFSTWSVLKTSWNWHNETPTVVSWLSTSWLKGEWNYSIEVCVYGTVWSAVAQSSSKMGLWSKQNKQVLSELVHVRREEMYIYFFDLYLRGNVRRGKRSLEYNCRKLVTGYLQNLINIWPFFSQNFLNHK